MGQERLADIIKLQPKNERILPPKLVASKMLCTFTIYQSTCKNYIGNNVQSSS